MLLPASKGGAAPDIIPVPLALLPLNDHPIFLMTVWLYGKHKAGGVAPFHAAAGVVVSLIIAQGRAGGLAKPGATNIL